MSGLDEILDSYIKLGVSEPDPPSSDHMMFRFMRRPLIATDPAQTWPTFHAATRPLSLLRKHLSGKQICKTVHQR